MKWYEKQKKLFEQDDVRNTQHSDVSEEKVSQSYAEREEPVQQVMESVAETEENYVPEAVLSQPDVTVIAERTLLVGDVESDCDVFVYGHIKGNIECPNCNITVCGEVEGKIHCANAVFENAVVRDDITCSGNLSLDSSSAVNGNLSAAELYVNGKIKGDIKAEDVIRLGSSSIVIGSISAADIEIERGSIIQGGLMIRQDYVSEN